MSDLSNTITNGFAAAYQDYAGRVRALAEPLSEEQFWRKPFPYGNSFGHLTLHLIGNLNYYVGAQIADTGYVRERDREFTETQPPSKAETLRRLDEVTALVVQTLNAQRAEDWSRDYQAVGADFTRDRFGIWLRCAAHFFHHIGQMIYLSKELARQEEQ